MTQDEFKQYMLVGFAIGLGFCIADQITWLLFDYLKNLTGIPLG